MTEFQGALTQFVLWIWFITTCCLGAPSKSLISLPCCEGPASTTSSSASGPSSRCDGWGPLPSPIWTTWQFDSTRNPMSLQFSLPLHLLLFSIVRCRKSPKDNILLFLQYLLKITISPKSHQRCSLLMKAIHYSLQAATHTNTIILFR